MKFPSRKIIYLTIFILFMGLFYTTGYNRVFSSTTKNFQVANSPAFQRHLAQTINGLNNKHENDISDIKYLNNNNLMVETQSAGGTSISTCYCTSGQSGTTCGLTCGYETCYGNTCEGTCEGCDGDDDGGNPGSPTPTPTPTPSPTPTPTPTPDPHEKEAEKKITETEGYIGDTNDKLKEEVNPAIKSTEEEKKEGEKYHTESETSLSSTTQPLTEAETGNEESAQSITDAQKNNSASQSGITKSGEYKEDAQEKTGYSSQSVADAEREKDKIPGIKDEAEKLDEKASGEITANNEKTAGNTGKVEETTAASSSEEDGEPVRVTTGEYCTEKQDLVVGSVPPAISIKRYYGSFNSESHSFGKGWSFNYDTRIIIGVRPDYVTIENELRELAEQVETKWEEAVAYYDLALAKANEAINFAAAAVEDAENAVNEATAAKELAEEAVVYAETGKKLADGALEKANLAWSYADTAKEKAELARNYLNTAKKNSEDAAEQANEAWTLANNAVIAAETAVAEANQTNNSELQKEATRVYLEATQLRGYIEETVQPDISAENEEITELLRTIEEETLVDIGQALDNAESARRTAKTNQTEADSALKIAKQLMEEVIPVITEAEDIHIEAGQQLTRANNCLAAVKDRLDLVNSIEDIKNQLWSLVEEARRIREYSEAAVYRNQYNVDRAANARIEQIGVGKVVLIDESGTPHIYLLDTQPDFDSRATFADGYINYYPNGSTATPTHPVHFGKLTEIRSRNGRYITFSYDPQQNLTSIKDLFGREILVTRVNGKITKITDPLGREYTYGYDGDNLVSFTDPEGNTWTYSYGRYGMETFRNPDGSGWTNYYKLIDDKWVVDYQEDTTGARYEFVYSPENRRTVIINRRGYTKTHWYNGHNFSEEIVNADGNSVYQIYDENNNLISYTDQNGNITRYTYDRYRNLTGITDPMGYSVNFTYNQYNQVTSICNKAGNMVCPQKVKFRSQ